MKPFRRLLYDGQLAGAPRGGGGRIAASLRATGYGRSSGFFCKYENNAVYRIATTSGEQFVVRVATTRGRSAEEQRSEMQWLEALRRKTSLVVPEPVRTLDGDLVAMIVPEGSMEAHVCVVLRWVSGTSPEPGLTLTLTEQIGAFTAEMHRYSERFGPERDLGSTVLGLGATIRRARSILHDENAIAYWTN